MFHVCSCLLLALKHYYHFILIIHALMMQLFN